MKNQLSYFQYISENVMKLRIIQFWTLWQPQNQYHTWIKWTRNILIWLCSKSSMMKYHRSKLTSVYNAAWRQSYISQVVWKLKWSCTLAVVWKIGPLLRVFVMEETKKKINIEARQLSIFSLTNTFLGTK